MCGKNTEVYKPTEVYIKLDFNCSSTFMLKSKKQKPKNQQQQPLKTAVN